MAVSVQMDDYPKGHENRASIEESHVPQALGHSLDCETVKCDLTQDQDKEENIHPLLRQDGSTPNAPGFGPETVTVVIDHNATVVWTNADQAPHTVTAKDRSFDSDVLPGAVFMFTFNTPGTYTYACDYHGWMNGTVIVKSG